MRWTLIKLYWESEWDIAWNPSTVFVTRGYGNIYRHLRNKGMMMVRGIVMCEESGHMGFCASPSPKSDMSK